MLCRSKNNVMFVMNLLIIKALRYEEDCPHVSFSIPWD